MLTIPYPSLKKYENVESAFHHLHDIRQCFNKAQPPSGLSEEVIENIRLHRQSMGYILSDVYTQILDSIEYPITLLGKLDIGGARDIEILTINLQAILADIDQYRINCLRMTNEIAPFLDSDEDRDQHPEPLEEAEAIKFYFAECFIANELTNLMLSVISKNNRLLTRFRAKNSEDSK